MRTYVAIVYNQPQTSRYDGAHEEKAVLGVLEAVAAVREALLELEYGVSLLPLTPPWPEAREELEALNADIVFNLFEGFCGEPETEALVPQTLAELKIPLTGCPAPALRLALDKARVKVILQAAGIPTPDFQLLNPRTLHLFRLGFPCIVKPRGEDASHGITAASVVRDAASLEKQVTAMSRTYGGALVEAFVGGREFNATVMGNSRYSLLPPSEINYSLPPEVPPILTFEAKWDTDSAYFRGTRVTCPAEITPGELKKIRRTALAAFRLTGCRGYARVDMRQDGEGVLHVLEVNPNPDISPGTGAARQALASGMTYAGFIKRIVILALEKEKHDRHHPAHVRGGQTGRNADTAQYARI